MHIRSSIRAGLRGATLLGLLAFAAPSLAAGSSHHAHSRAHKPVASTAAKPAASGQVGAASYYSSHFAGRRTASGERFNPGAMTAAHNSLPIGSLARVTNLRNGRSVVVRINDRGGFQRHGRILDLSPAAAQEIGMKSAGIAKVAITRVHGDS